MKRNERKLRKPNNHEGRTNQMKRTGAILLAIILIMAVCPAALAATIGESGLVSSGDKSVTIKKQITAYNPNGSDVNAPTITYSYTIEAGTSGKTVKDSNGITAATLAGPDGATITQSLSWSAAVTADQLNTAAGGKENFKTITADFKDVVFQSAGVYRYKITETAAYANTGVTDGNDHVRYLDVYVKNAATAGQYEIYGYVLFKNDNDIDASEDADDAAKVSAAAKTEGFVGDNVDKYYTYNLSVSKNLSGDDGMSSHKFPFDIRFTGNETGVLPIIGSNGKADIPSWSTAGAMSSFNSTAEGGGLKIANGGVVTVTGIPIGTSVQIFEKNDVTGTTYQASSSGADTNAAQKAVAQNEQSNTAIVNAQTASGTIADKNVVFTNTLALISPTGYVSRFAPYALILIGGIVLLVIATKRKKHNDED